MPYNPSGFFQRLFSWSNDRDAGIKIRADRMDQELDGLVDGLNQVISGEVDFKGPITGVFGTVGEPGYSFSGDPDTGIYRSASDQLAFSSQGAKVLELRSDELEAYQNFKKGTFKIDGGYLSFENGQHWITYNDGGGNFNIRVGNKYDGDELHTSASGAFHLRFDHESANPGMLMKVAAPGSANQAVSWAHTVRLASDGAFTLDGADIAVANKSTTFTDDQTFSGTAYFNSEVEFNTVGAGINFISDAQTRTVASFKQGGTAKMYIVHRDNGNIDFNFINGSTGFLTVDNHKLWHAGNDGAGSLLDADLLDGQQGTYYRNASNLNAGTVPAARLSGSYGISIAGTAANATQLEGQSGVFYRNASNLNMGTINNVRLPATIARTKVGTPFTYIEDNFLKLGLGDHCLSYNDGGGNFQLRVGHKYDGGEVRTEVGGPVKLGFTNDGVDGSFNIQTAANGPEGSAITWGPGLYGHFNGTLQWNGKDIVTRNIVQTHYNGAKNFAAAKNILLGDLNTTITPSSTNSQVLVTVNIAFECTHNGMFYLLRNNVEIGSAAAAGNRIVGMMPINFDNDFNSTMATSTITYLDSPNTTSAVTYKLGVRFLSSQEFSLNKTHSDSNAGNFERGTSRMICEEK